MNRRNALDEIHIRGQVYSIKKIQRLYARDEGMVPVQFSLLEPGFECPECKRFNEMKGDKPKFCKYCGQRLKWPRKKNVQRIKK